MINRHKMQVEWGGKWGEGQDDHGGLKYLRQETRGSGAEARSETDNRSLKRGGPTAQSTSGPRKNYAL